MFVPRSLLAAGLALLPVRVAAAQRIRAAAGAAGPLVANLGERAIRQRTPNDLSDAERVNRMRALLVEAFDVQAISKLVLGIYWRRTTEDQRAGFLKLYKTVVSHGYAGLFKKLISRSSDKCRWPAAAPSSMAASTG